MFILKRQDVEISSVQHPKKDQQIPILRYQGQTFRLLSIFSAAQEEDARALWRELTDNRGKACVLLEEPGRYSVWGKIRLDQLEGTEPSQGEMLPLLIQACLLLLQAVYIDIEDLLGERQVSAFRREIAAMFQRWRFPQTDSPDAIEQWLTVDPLAIVQMPPWREQHLNTLLQELHRLGKQYFGNANFAGRAMEVLQDLPESERRQFLRWLQRLPAGKLWQ